MQQFIQLTVDGLTLGSVYALIACVTRSSCPGGGSWAGRLGNGPPRRV